MACSRLQPSESTIPAQKEVVAIQSRWDDLCARVRAQDEELSKLRGLDARSKAAILREKSSLAVELKSLQESHSVLQAKLDAAERQRKDLEQMLDDRRESEVKLRQETEAKVSATEQDLEVKTAECSTVTRAAFDLIREIILGRAVQPVPPQR